MAPRPSRPLPSAADRLSSLFGPYAPSPRGLTPLPVPEVPHARLAQVRLAPGAEGLVLSFHQGPQVRIAAELLRVYSPSAEVRRGEGLVRVVAGKRGVRVSGVEAVGAYALRIAFSDGHSSGIFPHPYLAALALHRIPLSRAYLLALRARNLSRSPPFAL